MNKHYLLLIIALLWQTLPAFATPILPAIAPKINANSYLLVDMASGKSIVEHNIHTLLPPASLTKIMTIYVAAHELKENKMSLADEVLVSEKAWRAPGSRMFIEVEKRVSVLNLLKGIIIQSGNDASIALAEHIAGDEETFTQMMNYHSKRLGMQNTHYTNSTGLPHEKQYTTAYDLILLSRALIKEFPDIYAMHSELDFEFANIKQNNRNQLLWQDDSFDGIKTGYTEAAGYCLVSSAKRDGMRLISVVMGSKSIRQRTQASKSLINFGFRFYESKKIYEKGKPIEIVKVWKGEKDQVNLGTTEDIYILYPKNQKEELKVNMTIQPNIIAPIAIGALLGKINIKIADKVLAETSIVALEKIATGNILKRLQDGMLLWMN